MLAGDEVNGTDWSLCACLCVLASCQIRELRSAAPSVVVSKLDELLPPDLTNIVLQYLKKHGSVLYYTAMHDSMMI